MTAAEARSPARPETADRHWFDVDFWPDRDPDGVAALPPVTVRPGTSLWITPGGCGLGSGDNLFPAHRTCRVFYLVRGLFEGWLKGSSQRHPQAVHTTGGVSSQAIHRAVHTMGWRPAPRAGKLS